MTERPNVRATLVPGSDRLADITQKYLGVLDRGPPAVGGGRRAMALGNGGASAWEGTTMPNEAVQMQQIGQAVVEQPARPPSLSLAWALGKAWVALAGSYRHTEQSPDGLEALDMLGGWKGSDGRRP